MLNQSIVSFNTIFMREVVRFLRIWTQTILPPVITMFLYFVIFGHLIGPRIGLMQSVPYNEYIAPGLVMLSVISSAYANVSSSLFSSRFQRNLEEVLVSPTSNSVMIWGYVLGGVVRGMCVGLAVTVISSAFIGFHFEHVGLMLLVMFLCSTLFSLMGFTNGIFARTFDDIMIIPSFVLTPLTYLGGVFYSIHMLSPFWATVSLFNPVLHIVNAFRFAWLGVSDIPIFTALAMMTGVTIGLYLLNLWLLHRGTRIKS
jgi:ABC-2 type transport system permease protein